MEPYNPPVIEAWIEFYPDLAEEGSDFNEKDAKEFIEKHVNYKSEEDAKKFKIDIRFLLDPPHLKDGRIEFDKRRFKKLIAKNKDKGACIQVERTLLVYNQIKTGNIWPGYEKMRDEAYKILESYLKFRKLISVHKMALHYRDFVSLPKGTDAISLNDYFNIYPKIEGNYGDISAFNLSIQLPKACTDSITDLTIATIITKSETSSFDFIMDWHVRSNPNIALDNDNGRTWLERAHADLKRIFSQILTDKAKQTIGMTKV